MKILAINSVPFGSTGKIMMQILDCAEQTVGAETVAYFGAWKKEKSNHPKLFKFGSYFENRISFFFSYFTGFHNVGSVFNTLSLIKKIKAFKPDIIHLHNLHLWVINLPIFFRFLKKSNIKVIWTLHDCWAFTGQCPYFTMVKCEKWKTGCYNCPSYQGYPNSCVDRTKQMYNYKKKWFCDVKNLTIVTPSQWLADLVKQSFLKDYPIKVINNGIDLSVFKPTESNFREKYNVSADKKIILGVAFGWSIRKGRDVMIELSKRLDSKYQIVLVGTTDEEDRLLPNNIISIHRTQNQTELAEIYSAADLFVNPTREEVLGMVNVESLACGTPVVTFNTGGSPEVLDKTCGYAVECDDIDALESKINEFFESDINLEKNCLKRAENFDMYDKCREYIKLYKKSY